MRVESEQKPGAILGEAKACWDLWGRLAGWNSRTLGLWQQDAGEPHKLAASRALVRS